MGRGRRRMGDPRLVRVPGVVAVGEASRRRTQGRTQEMANRWQADGDRMANGWRRWQRRFGGYGSTASDSARSGGRRSGWQTDGKRMANGWQADSNADSRVPYPYPYPTLRE